MFCVDRLVRCTIWTYMCAYERGPVAKTVYSDNQNNVDALAERLSSQTSLSAERAKLVAYDLLCRKALKIKSSALAQIFRSVDKECDTKAMRDELIAANIVTKIEGSGINGRPAFYTINVEIRDAQEQPAESVEDFVVEDSADVPAVEEVAPREHVDTDELLDENVVRAFTAKAGRGGFGGGGKRDAQRRAQQERFRRTVARKGETDAEAVENEVAAESQRPAKEQKPVEAQEPQRRRGAHFKAAQQDVAHEVEELSEAADDVEESAKKAPGSCRPGRGFARRAYPVRRQEKGEPASTAQPRRPNKPRKPLSRRLASSNLPSRSLRLTLRSKLNRPLISRLGRAPQASPAVVVTAAVVAQMPRPRPRRQRHKTEMRRPRLRWIRSSASRRRRPSPIVRKSARLRPSRNVIPGQIPSVSLMHRLSLPRLIVLPSSPSRPSTARYRRLPLPAFWQAAAQVVPTPTALSKIKEQQTQIVKVEGKDGKKAPQRTQHNEMSNRKIAEEIAIIQAWIEQNRGADTPVASRRQRAYQLFNDEKAFDGKHGERLIRRMTEKGISMQAIKVAPNRPVHFTGFFTLGADKPFIMVENLDTYDEIVRLLRGRKHAKLFGIKVGGVIFGGGCKASVSHALDDYLAEIGYRFNYVYYVGDIDREGARIVEQARNANVVEIRLHAGMYRAMLAEHKRRVKAGGECEPAAANQGVPQNLAATIKDLPMVTRVQFRNVLREGGRIPQEILMTADYRDGDSGSFDRMLNN